MIVTKIGRIYWNVNNLFTLATVSWKRYFCPLKLNPWNKFLFCYFLFWPLCQMLLLKRVLKQKHVIRIRIICWLILVPYARVLCKGLKMLVELWNHMQRFSRCRLAFLLYTKVWSCWRTFTAICNGLKDCGWFVQLYAKVWMILVDLWCYMQGFLRIWCVCLLFYMSCKNCGCCMYKLSTF